MPIPIYRYQPYISANRYIGLTLVLISLNTYCVCLVFLGAGSSELGVADDVGNCTGVVGGVCGEVLGDAGGCVHVTGDLTEGVRFVVH